MTHVPAGSARVTTPSMRDEAVSGFEPDFGGRRATVGRRLALEVWLRVTPRLGLNGQSQFFSNQYLPLGCFDLHPPAEHLAVLQRQSV